MAVRTWKGEQSATVEQAPGMGSAHVKAGGSAGTRSPPCTTRMLVPTMEWKAFLNTSLPTLHQQHRYIDAP